MITLRRYLDAVNRPQRRGEPVESVRDAPPWPEFTAAIVDCVSRYVLDGEPYGDIREDLRILNETIRSAAQPPDPAAGFERPIEEFRRRANEASRNQFREMTRMLATMNEALLLLAAGSDRTVGALKQMETTLEHASKLNDISSLKSKVNEVVAAISRETVREREDSARAISTLQQQISAARSTFSSIGAEFADREHAIGVFRQALAPGARPSMACVFVLQRIRAIVARYGKEAAVELLHELIRARIQPLAPESASFLWSEDSAVLLIENPDLSVLKDQIRAQVEPPFEHRLVAGGRLVTLNASVRSVLLPIHDSPEFMAAEIDRFVSGGAH